MSLMLIYPVSLGCAGELSGRATASDPCDYSWPWLLSLGRTQGLRSQQGPIGERGQGDILSVWFEPVLVHFLMQEQIAEANFTYLFV